VIVMPLQTLALFFLVTVAAGGVIWVFVYPLLSGERQG
jgi:tight adherence protein B